jgi:phosphogluconate dehydratase
MHPIVTEITERIQQRSQATREAYLSFIKSQKRRLPRRFAQGETNFAHVQASATDTEKLILRTAEHSANFGIVTAYNDMLSAHQPFLEYPEQIKQHLIELGHTAQVAGGVPAMCDGVTQGQDGMELSLFSRDVIAQSTAIGLCHDAFDGIFLLGTCDKIVPGILIGALRFGYLPMAFVPAGPMATGIPNEEKAVQRELFVKGKISKEALLASESKAYHSPGTCTFYGTSNTNQMLIEAMGLTLPGSVFEHPNGPLRQSLTKACVAQLVNRLPWSGNPLCLGEQLNEKAWVNALIVLLATGGSTNLSLHLVAMAKMAGIQLTWDDMAALSKVTPLIAKVYPNGQEDINAFHQAGGTSLMIQYLLEAQLLHQDIDTLLGHGLSRYQQVPYLDSQQTLKWKAVTAPTHSEVLRPVDKAFTNEGGLVLMTGNLGRAINKRSAVAKEHWYIKAKACVFHCQEQAKAAFQKGHLNQDAVWVVVGQGPKANGMPELHKLMPCLSSLQKEGYKVALVTDGRLSGASGKVPTAIHLSPEAVDQGPISKIREGDWIEVDLEQGRLNVLESDFDQRPTPNNFISSVDWGQGRELFKGFRERVTSAEEGALSIDWE